MGDSHWWIGTSAEGDAQQSQEKKDLHITKFIVALGTDRGAEAINMVGFQDCFVK